MPVSVVAHRCSIARRAALAAAALALLVAAGCTHPREPVRLDSRDTNARIAAIKRAAASKDRSAAPQLVAALEDDDPAVRFFAIGALHRMAGDRLDYDYFDDADARKPAVARWRQWLTDQGLNAQSPPPRRSKRK